MPQMVKKQKTSDRLHQKLKKRYLCAAIKDCDLLITLDYGIFNNRLKESHI